MFAVKIVDAILVNVVLIVILSNANAVLIVDAILANVVMYQIQILIIFQIIVVVKCVEMSFAKNAWVILAYVVLYVMKIDVELKIVNMNKNFWKIVLIIFLV